jgi:nucleotide-binding universal stress UspA family protein
MLKIVVAIDGSVVARHALSAVLDLSEELREAPAVHAVAVVDYLTLPAGLANAPSWAPDLLCSDAETALAVAAELARIRHRALECRVLQGHVVSEVLTYAGQVGASMIAVGTHGRKGIRRAVLGSTCEGLLRESKIPVLAVHIGEAP